MKNRIVYELRLRFPPEGIPGKGYDKGLIELFFIVNNIINKNLETGLRVSAIFNVVYFISLSFVISHITNQQSCGLCIKYQKTLKLSTTLQIRKFA